MRWSRDLDRFRLGGWSARLPERSLCEHAPIGGTCGFGGQTACLGRRIERSTRTIAARSSSRQTATGSFRRASSVPTWSRTATTWSTIHGQFINWRSFRRDAVAWLTEPRISEHVSGDRAAKALVARSTANNTLAVRGVSPPRGYREPDDDTRAAIEDAIPPRALPAARELLDALEGLVDGGPGDDSRRDYAIAGLLHHHGCDEQHFIAVIQRLPRSKDEKRFRLDYLHTTWLAAGQKSVSRPAAMTNSETDALRRAAEAGPVRKALGSGTLAVLDWLVNEACAHRSWRIIPGVSKISQELGRSESVVSRHLRRLEQFEIVNYTSRSGPEDKRRSKEIDLKPLVDPSAVHPSGRDPIPFG